VTDEVDRPGRRRFSSPGGRLAQRLVAAPHTPQERQDSSPRRSAGRLKAVLIGIVYWSTTVLVALGAWVLMAAAGSISAQHQADLEERAQDGFGAQDRIAAAEQGLEGLPRSEEAQRWLLQATTAGESVAEAQNTFLDHTGPIDVGDLPEQTPRLGERDECAPYLDDPPPRGRDYTEEERIACAEGLRESAVGGLERKLTPHFAAGARDSDGFNAVSQWHSSVPTLDDDASLAGYTWTTHQAQVFEEDTAIRMVWTLTEDETGRTVAWLRGEYDPGVKKFDHLVLGTVAAADEDGTGEPVDGGGGDERSQEPGPEHASETDSGGGER
jgi:hypothetical protein